MINWNIYYSSNQPEQHTYTQDTLVAKQINDHSHDLQHVNYVQHVGDIRLTSWRHLFLPGHCTFQFFSYIRYVWNPLFCSWVTQSTSTWHYYRVWVHDDDITLSFLEYLRANCPIDVVWNTLGQDGVGLLFMEANFNPKLFFLLAFRFHQIALNWIERRLNTFGLALNE